MIFDRSFNWGTLVPKTFHQAKGAWPEAKYTGTLSGNIWKYIEFLENTISNCEFFEKKTYCKCNWSCPFES